MLDLVGIRPVGGPALVAQDSSTAVFSLETHHFDVAQSTLIASALHVLNFGGMHHKDSNFVLVFASNVADKDRIQIPTGP